MRAPIPVFLQSPELFEFMHPEELKLILKSLYQVPLEREELCNATLVALLQPFLSFRQNAEQASGFRVTGGAECFKLFDQIEANRYVGCNNGCAKSSALITSNRFADVNLCGFVDAAERQLL
jgi:hypothetical protein